MVAPDIKAIVFDCFGVLYTDTKQSLLDTVAGDKRQELSDLFTSNNYGYFSRQEYLKQVAEIVGKTESETEEYISHEHQLNSTLMALISEQLKKHYKIGLLSNIGQGWVDEFFSKHQLHELFDEVVLSGDEGLVKPNPAIFELMAQRLGLKTDECIMIDDIQRNCEGAQDAGMYSIHYVSNGQLLEKLQQLQLL